MEYKEKLVERKETRRHQSLDKSLENGWDVPDPRTDVQEAVERNEEKSEIHNALRQLTDKQRTVLLCYIVEDLSFREIGTKLGLNKDTVREHYLSAVKKMKKVLEKTPSNSNSCGY